MHEKNIIKSFFTRSFIAMIFISIISSGGIYLYQNKIFISSLEKNIQSFIDTDIGKYTHLTSDDEALLTNDIKHFMRRLNFLSVEVYDQNKKKLFEVISDDKTNQENLELFENDNKYLIHNFPNSKKLSSNFFELPGEKYFMQIFYPIIKNGHTIGYIEGISCLSSAIVNSFKQNIIATIFVVLFTIIILVSILFPIIYFAYKQLEQSKQDLLSSNILMINTLGNAIALRDSDTNEHNYRVTIYAIKLAQKIKLSDDEIQKLIKGAFLHDVGKIGISDNVLLKNGKLTEEEFRIMKQHVEKGVELIEGNHWLEDSKDVILCHHEKYNGSGYPQALQKDAIPMTAKIFSIVDVFDALTSKRPYKEPFSYEKSMEIIVQDSGKHFDPALVRTFSEISYDLYNEIRLKDHQALKSELDQLVQKYFLN